MRVQRPIPSGGRICLGFAALRRAAPSELFLSKLDLLFYSTLTSLELSSNLWSFCNVVNSALGPSFCDVLPHLSGWRSFVDALQNVVLYRD